MWNMYNNRIFSIIFILIATIGLTVHASEAAETIEVTTHTDVYYEGDTIVVFGNVSTLFENLPVTIQIYLDTTLIDVAQVPVALDGTYFKDFNAGGQVWKEDGTYTVRAFYTETIIGETTFEFYKQVVDKSSAVLPVDIPNSGTFDVGYTIRGGEVKDVQMDSERYSILVETSMSTQGNIVLKLPRESFDAQSNGTDETFIVLVSKEDASGGVDYHHIVTRLNFVQVEYEEIGTGSDYRTIRIPLEAGDKWIEIIGTYVIPEFGSVVMIILLVAVASTIIISKGRLSVRYN